MTDGFVGDPFHEGAEHPMDSLKGGMNGPSTQMPMDSDAMTNPRSAATEVAGQSWTGFLAPSAGSTGSNDANQLH